ncbi:MAG TPA: hypothetical protein VGI81_01205 [Tepidisphaeraceae bacterium]|jgi:hypothetical protein
MSIEGIRFGVYAATFGPDPRHAARAARETGFAGLQFDARAPGLDITELTASGRREFRHVLTAQDAQLIGLRADVGPAGLGPGADVDRAISRLDKVMEAAAGLGSPLVCVELGPLPPAPVVEAERPAVTPLQAGLILLPESAAPPPPPKPAAPPPDPAFVDQVNGGARRARASCRPIQRGARISIRIVVIRFVGTGTATGGLPMVRRGPRPGRAAAG